MDSSPGETSETQFPVVDPLDQGPDRSRAWLVIAIGTVVVITLVWLYILFGYKPKVLIDEIPDHAFAEKAERVCAVAKLELDQLPFASEARTADDRADTVEQSNEILNAMVSELRPLAPEKPAVAKEAVDEWLGDWETYIHDRELYVDNLRKDADARFLETAKGSPNKGITRAITGFAQVNRMNSCSTPADLS